MVKSHLKELHMTDTQIKKIMEPNLKVLKRTWTAEDISLAFAIRSLSKKTYK